MSEKQFEEYPDNEDIEESEGGIPGWFNGLFLLTVIFAAIYAPWYHLGGHSQAGDYQKAVEQAAKLAPKQVQAVELTAEGTNPFRGKAEAIEAGQKHYSGICAACHKPDMTGLVGPSLVDQEWLHGKTDKAVYDVIMDGVSPPKTKLNKGPMPAHKIQLGSRKVLEVMAYLASKNPSMTAK